MTDKKEVSRPWGCFVVLEDQDSYKVKRVVVNPKSRLSLQRHQYRSEHWIITKGRALVTYGSTPELFLHPGQCITIHYGTLHRIANTSETETLEFIEVQRGSYFGEDDIERVEDDYGREAFEATLVEGLALADRIPSTQVDDE